MQSRFAAKNPFNPLTRFGKRGRHGFGHRHNAFGRAAAQFEFQPPTLRAGVRDAPELESSDLRQHGLQMYRNSSALGIGSFEQSMDRGQGVEIVAHRNDVA